MYSVSIETMYYSFWGVPNPGFLDVDVITFMFNLCVLVYVREKKMWFLFLLTLRVPILEQLPAF